MLAQVTKADARRQLAANQLAGGAGDERSVKFLGYG
jgi:hypothetical protein